MFMELNRVQVEGVIIGRDQGEESAYSVNSLGIQRVGRISCSLDALSYKPSLTSILMGNGTQTFTGAVRVALESDVAEGLQENLAAALQTL